MRDLGATCLQRPVAWRGWGFLNRVFSTKRRYDKNR